MLNYIFKKYRCEKADLYHLFLQQVGSFDETLGVVFVAWCCKINRYFFI